MLELFLPSGAFNWSEAYFPILFQHRVPQLPTWNTMCLTNVCLVQRTTYSVSSSVRATGSGEDLKSGPRPRNSGIAPSCSATEDTETIARSCCSKNYPSNINKRSVGTCKIKGKVILCPYLSQSRQNRTAGTPTPQE